MEHKKFLSVLMIFVIVSSIYFVTHAAAVSQETVLGERELNEIRKTVVFIGNLDQPRTVLERTKTAQLNATGFLVQVEGVFHLLTAKHIVIDENSGRFKDDGMLVFLNLRNGAMKAVPIKEVKARFGVDWVFHSNPAVDVAIIPFPIDPATDDVKVVPDNMFRTSDSLYELNDIFFLSYQPGIEPMGRIAPIFRSGVISIIERDRTYFIDAFAFPGNSGSPVFLKRDRTLAGIVGKYMSYSEVAVSAQTGRPRVLFEENTGLSKVWSVEYIKEVLDSAACRKQLGRIKLPRG